jgi:radical SAM superfamily enzyme YgiQ (UPF0313 family)
MMSLQELFFLKGSQYLCSMTTPSKRLLLINPANQYRKGYLLRRESKQAPLALGIIAALTPPGWQIRILDENFREFKFREADLVGITAVTASVNRAYEIAAEYRSHNIPVVMGGIHVSSLPEEALHYADAVVIGEAEGAWQDVLRDFESGHLRQRYQSGLTDLKDLPPARHDLFHPGYLFASIQTSRGCPMDCDFCSVPWFNGNKYRLRHTEAILDEIRSVQSPMLYFVDDNIIGYNREAEEHAGRLFEGMIRKGIRKDWFAQASVNIAEKPEILRLAARSGCRMLLIGIESEDPEALKSSNKRLNLRLGVENYRKAYHEIHRHGINVLGAFIYGMETDTVHSIRKRTDYIVSSSIDVTQASVMTPLPGTRIFQRMKDEGRLLCRNFPEDWQHFHFTDVVFQPSRMKAQELADATNKAYDRITTMSYIRFRFLRTWWNTRSLRSAVWAWNSNLNYRSIALEGSVSYRY